MKVKILDPNVLYASKKLGERGEIITSKNTALKIGMDEKEVVKVFNMFIKKGLLAIVDTITVKMQDIPKRKRAKPIQDKIEVANVNNSINSFE